MTDNLKPEVAVEQTSRESLDDLDIRCIRTITGEAVFAIVLKELPDSFLVGAPIKLVSNPDNSFAAIPLSPIGYIRIFKTSLFSYSKVTDLYRYWYFKYLNTGSGGRKLIPELLSDVVLKLISEYTRTFQLENPKLVEIIPTGPEGESFPMPLPETTAEYYEKQGITGLSKEAFEPHYMSLLIN